MFGSFFHDLDLADSVRAGGSIISFRCMGSPDTISEINEIQDLLLRRHKLLLQPLNLNFLLLVLQNLQLFVIVEEVKEFAAVDLEHGDGDSVVALFLLEVVDAFVEQVLDRQLLQPLHRVRLPRTRLPIRKHSHHSLVEGEVDDGSDGVVVEFGGGLLVRERVVEGEVLVVDVLCNSIHLELAIMHNDLRIHARNAVDLAVGKLLREYGPLLHAHADLHLVSWNVRSLLWESHDLLLYHLLKVHIHFDSMRLIHSFSLRFLLPHLLHLFPPFFSLLLQPLDLLQTTRLLHLIFEQVGPIPQRWVHYLRS